MAAPTWVTRQKVMDRDLARCVACNASDPLTFQHRRAVGAGGSKIQPPPVDGLVLCMYCNAACEGTMQTLALANGWKVQRWADPSLVPVYYPHEFTWCRLEGATRTAITSVVALDLMHAVYGDKYMHWYTEAHS